MSARFPPESPAPDGRSLFRQPGAAGETADLAFARRAVRAVRRLCRRWSGARCGCRGCPPNFLQKQGESRYARTLELPATRGKIIDRNGQVLASSLPVKAIWAIPDDVLQAPPEKLRELAGLLEMSERDLRKKLDSDRSFVYLKRQVEHETADKIVKLGIAGIETRKEYKRFYPEGEVMAHVVGFTNVEDAGQEGMELAQQKTLAGVTGSRRVIKDRLGRIVEDIEAIREPHDGRDLALSIDSKMQYIAFSHLKEAVEQIQGQGGRHRGAGRQDRRSAGAGQPADLQPEQPRRC